jgi:hypothetical protein
MASYIRIRLANGDTRHATLPQDETHAQWAAREFGAESRWTQTIEGTLVAQAPRWTACCRRRPRARRRGGARGFLSETLRDEPDHACGSARSGYRPD